MNSRYLVAAIALAASGTASAEEWRWSVTPYLWATDVGIDVTLRDREIVDATIPFEELLKDLQSAVLIRADAMRGEHGIAADLFDVVLADEYHAPLPNGSGDEVALDAEIGMTIFDLAGVYDPAGDGRGPSFLYGTRVINQREDIEAAVTSGGEPGPGTRIDENDSYVDALLGVRYAGDLPGRWSYEFAADVSTGGTQLTWSIAPAVGYNFGERDQYRLSAGYRHMVVDFNKSSDVDMDMTLSGVLVGFRFDF
jgi:hypothetical protein